MPENPNINNDAREFGLHLVQGGWRLGLLVARNVVRAPGRVAVETLAPKTNASEFARAAKTSTARVLRFLDAWERAADAGHVPHASELTPGQEVLTLNGHAFMIDAEVMPSWRSFYQTPRPPAPTPPPEPQPTRSNYTATREHEPVLPDPREVRAAERRMDAAIDAADARYRAARDEGNNRLMPMDSGDEQDPDVLALRAHTARAAEVAEVVGALRHYTERLYALALDPEWQERGRNAAATKARSIAERLTKVADYIHSEGAVTDKEIRELMNSDG